MRLTLFTLVFFMICAFSLAESRFRFKRQFGRNVIIEKKIITQSGSRPGFGGPQSGFGGGFRSGYGGPYSGYGGGSRSGFGGPYSGYGGGSRSGFGGRPQFSETIIRKEFRG